MLFVDHPAEYRWSRYRTYLGLERCPKWLEVSPALEQFGRTRKEQIARYRESVESEMPEDPLREMVHGALLGTPGFVELVRERLARRKPTGEAARLREALPRRDLHVICQAVAQVYQCPEEDLRVRGRKLNRARDVVIYLARQHGGLPLTELGDHLGGIGGPAVSLAYRRVAEQIILDRKLRRQVEQLRKKLAGTETKIDDKRG